jgi:hypothetical protein
LLHAEKGKKGDYSLSAGERKGLFRKKRDCDKAVTQTPASESQTQVAVNSEGKTRSASRRVTLATSKNEQTKGVKEPLQQSQTAPKDTKQKEQQDNAVKQDKPEKI